VDLTSNKVTTYLFVDIELNSDAATVSDLAEEIRIIKEQQFEFQNYPKDGANFCLNLEDKITMELLLEFNKTFLSQIWANLFPQ
jgi:hypothetical protein